VWTGISVSAESSLIIKAEKVWPIKTLNGSLRVLPKINKCVKILLYCCKFERDGYLKAVSL
jgi:hypothetical protein